MSLPENGKRVIDSWITFQRVEFSTNFRSENRIDGLPLNGVATWVDSTPGLDQLLVYICYICTSKLIHVNFYRPT